MPKWKKGAREFTVGVNFNEARGYQTSIPKPVAEAMGWPTSITYLIRGKRIEVRRSFRSEPPETKKTDQA